MQMIFTFEENLDKLYSWELTTSLYSQGLSKGMYYK